MAPPAGCPPPTPLSAGCPVTPPGVWTARPGLLGVGQPLRVRTVREGVHRQAVRQLRRPQLTESVRPSTVWNVHGLLAVRHPVQLWAVWDTLCMLTVWNIHCLLYVWYPIRPGTVGDILRPLAVWNVHCLLAVRYPVCLGTIRRLLFTLLQCSSLRAVRPRPGGLLVRGRWPGAQQVVTRTVQTVLTTPAWNTHNTNVNGKDVLHKA